MRKFAIDYSSLSNTILKKAYPLNEVKDKIERVAFDMVKFKDDDNSANLWQIQSSDDGEYIVAIYQNEDGKTSTASCNWDVNIKNANNLQVLYKGDPIVVIAGSKLGIPYSELHKIKSYLPHKLSENKKLVKSLLNELNETAKKDVLSRYPELN